MLKKISNREPGGNRSILATAPILAAMFLALCGSLPLPVEARSSTTREAPSSSAKRAVDAVVKSELAKSLTVGATVGILRHGKVVLLSGYGLSDMENNIPTRPNSTFRIGSITKQFTAAGIMLLQERGKLSIDDKLSKYFPDFPDATDVTLRQMMSHTSGIRDYAGNDDIKTPLVSSIDHTTAEMVSIIASQKNLYDFKPGTRYAYSNSGYFLLGAIIEKVTNQSLSEFFNLNIFRPFSLSDTRIDEDDVIVPNRARGYMRRNGITFNRPYYSITVARGAGGLRSTAPDLLRWMQLLFDGRIVNGDSLTTLTTPARLANGGIVSPARVEGEGRPAVEMALGLRIGTWFGRTYIGHEGQIPGYNSALYRFPKQDVTIVVLTNTGDGLAAPILFWKIADAYFKAEKSGE